MRKIIVIAVTTATIIAVSVLWSTFVLVKPEVAVTKPVTVETVLSISPIEIMVQNGSNLPVEKWDGNPFWPAFT